MLSKLFLVGVMTTGAVGSTAATGITPTGIEFAAGPIHMEAGNGDKFSLYMGQHTPLTLTIYLQGEPRLHVKF